jgi:hypothetical protein
VSEPCRNLGPYARNTLECSELLAGLRDCLLAIDIDTVKGIEKIRISNVVLCATQELSPPRAVKAYKGLEDVHYV